MRYIVTRQNEHEAPQVPEFARTNGFDLLTLRTLSIMDAPEDTHQTLLPQAPEFRPYEYREGQRVQRDDHLCTEPYWFPCLYADGTVTPCIHDCHAEHPMGVVTPCIHDCHAEYPMGVVTAANTFRDVWFGRQAADVRARLRNKRTGFCVQCPYADRPMEGCSIQAFYPNPQARRCEIRL